MYFAIYIVYMRLMDVLVIILIYRWKYTRAITHEIWAKDIAIYTIDSPSK